METQLTRAVLVLNLVVALLADDTTNISLSNSVSRQAGVAAGSNTTDKVTTYYSYHFQTTAGVANSTSKTGNPPVVIAVSKNNTINKELYNYTITPSKLDVKIGDSYALTCKTDSSKGLDQLSWIIKTNFENHKLLNCDGKNEEGLKCEIREFPNGLFSVLNVTSFEDRNSHSSVDYTFCCTGHILLLANRQQLLQQQQQQGVAVVTVHPVDHNLETGLEVAGGSLLVLVVLVAAFLVFRKGQLRSAFAGMRDI